jgi:hypothetical protein
LNLAVIGQRSGQTSSAQRKSYVKILTENGWTYDSDNLKLLCVAKHEIKHNQFPPGPPVAAEEPQVAMTIKHKPPPS